MKRNSNKVIEVLGPVDNLESYVKADWWQNLFTANYLRTDGDVVEDSSLTNKEVDLFIRASSINKNAIVLDLCCGQGRHTIALAKKGFSNLFGLDRSHYLIDRARKVAKESKLDINFKEGDARKLPFKNNYFDFVFIAGNSFGYFESIEDDHRVLAEIGRVLKSEGMLLIDISNGDYLLSHYEPRSWEWIDKNYFVCRERELTKDSSRLISREVITHAKKGVVADQFYAERLYSKNTIEEILLSENFLNVKNVHTYKTESKRDQDLGMMAERIIVTARIKKKVTIAKKETNKQKHVLVLLGDPSKE